MKNDDFGNRMKEYEKIFTSIKLDKNLPVYARLDGRSFSKFTSKMQRPFDERMSKAMIDTTAYLVNNTNATVGYTQSDEISLVWNPYGRDESEFMFDCKIQKLASVLASMCSSKFLKSYHEYFENFPNKLPSFDCRIINVPSETEANNMLLWRKQDAFRNSVQSAAHHHFGHKALMHVKTGEKINMLQDAGIDFYEHFPISFRVGTTVVKTTVVRYLNEYELAKIPEKFRPTEPVVRNDIEYIYDTQVEDKFKSKKEQV